MSNIFWQLHKAYGTPKHFERLTMLDAPVRNDGFTSAFKNEEAERLQRLIGNMVKRKHVVRKPKKLDMSRTVINHLPRGVSDVEQIERLRQLRELGRIPTFIKPEYREYIRKKLFERWNKKYKNAEVLVNKLKEIDRD